MILRCIRTQQRRPGSIETVASWDGQRTVASVVTETIKFREKLQSINHGESNRRSDSRRLNLQRHRRRVDESRKAKHPVSSLRGEKVGGEWWVNLKSR